MRYGTLFSLHSTYTDARNAVESLKMEKEIPDKAINVVVEENVAKLHLSDHLDLHKASTRKSAAAAQIAVSGLDAILIDQQGRKVPDTGSVYFAGDFAVVLGRMADTTGRQLGLARAMGEFGIPEPDAKIFADGIAGGGFLLLIHGPEDMIGKAAAVLRRYNSVKIGYYAGGAGYS